LFERGDYRSFDLRDQDQFNDICSVTSVLKTYLRSLPVPLLTYDLNDEFIMAAAIKDPDVKYEALLDAVNKLPNEYYYTLRLLMLHLHKWVHRFNLKLSADFLYPAYDNIAKSI
jgi:Rho-type GTPase-activating protein 1/2